jgi:hypothetical protein
LPDGGFTAALARLLTDSRLRSEFAVDRQELCQHLRVGGAARRRLLGLSPEELEVQAALLVDKRRHQVARLLPRTFGRLGRVAGALFAEYAASRWPVGHRRHWLDAAGFSAWLAGRRPDTREARECNRVDFMARQGRATVRLVRRVEVAGRTGPAAQILLRRSGGCLDVLLYLLPFMKRAGA